MRTLQRVVGSPIFDGAILAVILANAVVLGMQTYPSLVRSHGDTLELLNVVFLGIFVVEIALRIASHGRRPLDYFRNGWNVFDFLTVAVAFLPGVRDSSTLLRVARLLRVVRVVRLLPDLRVLVVAVARSLPPLFSLLLLTVLMLFAYGMLGWLMFGDTLVDDWGTIGDAMLTLFVLLTLENFPVYLEEGMAVHTWSWLYFASYVLVTALLLLNVLIGIVLNSMEEARELERRRRVGDIAAAPVTERIAMLRAALTELEAELTPRGRAGSGRESR